MDGHSHPCHSHGDSTPGSTTYPPEYFVFTHIFDPLVHQALRPVLTRAVIGEDRDCMDILTSFCSREMQAVIVEDHPCSCCDKSGKVCIAAAKVVKTWPRANWAFATRCIECALNHKFCDLPLRTRTLTCTCGWMIPDADRSSLERRSDLNRFYARQLGLPFEKRAKGKVFGCLIKKLTMYNDWFLQHAEMGYEMRLKELYPAMFALGRADLIRDDGRWILPFRTDWQPCPCYPASPCCDHEHRDWYDDNESDIETIPHMDRPSTPVIEITDKGLWDALVCTMSERTTRRYASNNKNDDGEPTPGSGGGTARIVTL